MALLTILHHPDPRLRQKAGPVERFDAEFQRLVDDMFETMYAAPGVGLAATQVGIPLRLAVMDCSREEGRREPLVMANPEILDPRRGGLVGLEALMRKFLLPHLPRVVQDLRAASEGADLLLTHPAQLASPIVAELTGIRWITLSVFPGNIPTRYGPPQGTPLRARQGRLGQAMNGLAWKLARRARC